MSDQRVLPFFKRYCAVCGASGGVPNLRFLNVLRQETTQPLHPTDYAHDACLEVEFTRIRVERVIGAATRQYPQLLLLRGSRP